MRILFLLCVVGCYSTTESSGLAVTIDAGDSFHCIPDGDTAAAIQACVDEVSSGPTGGVVELKAQFYWLETAVQVNYPYVVIKGKGNGATTIYNTWGGIGFAFEECYSCGLQDMLIYSGLEDDTSMAIFTRKTEELRINNVNIRMEGGIGICIQTTTRASLIDVQVWADQPVVYLYGVIQHINFHNSVLMEFGGDHPIVETKPAAILGADVTYTGYTHHHDNQ